MGGQKDAAGYHVAGCWAGGGGGAPLVPMLWHGGTRSPSLHKAGLQTHPSQTPASPSHNWTAAASFLVMPTLTLSLLQPPEEPEVKPEPGPVEDFERTPSGRIRRTSAQVAVFHLQEIAEDELARDWTKRRMKDDLVPETKRVRTFLSPFAPSTAPAGRGLTCLVFCALNQLATMANVLLRSPPVAG